MLSSCVGVVGEPFPLQADAATPDEGEPNSDAGLFALDAGRALDAGLSALDAGATRDAGAAPFLDGGGYNPCPAATPCRFMPLGDSITEGYEGGYRIPLFRKVLAANQSIVFVGTQANGPAIVDGVTFSRAHEGHAGYSIDATHSQYNIADLIDASLSTNQPDIIALMIGTNDVSRSHLTDSADRLGHLLDQLIADAPSALIIVALITPTQSDDDNVFVRQYNDAIPAVVAARVALGKHLVLVDMYSAFTADPAYKTSLLIDNFHPGDSGNVVLASVWYEAVRPLLH